MSKTETEAIAAVTRRPEQPPPYSRQPNAFDEGLIDQIIQHVGWPKGIEKKEKLRRKVNLQNWLRAIHEMVYWDTEGKRPTRRQQERVLRELGTALDTAKSRVNELLKPDDLGKLPGPVNRAFKIGGATDAQATVKSLMKNIDDIKDWATTAAKSEELAYPTPGRLNPRENAIANLARVYQRIFQRKPGTRGAFPEFLRLCLREIYNDIREDRFPKKKAAQKRYPGSLEPEAVRMTWRRVSTKLEEGAKYF